MGAIQNGLIKKVGANRLPLLLVILSYMDKDGRAFPSQRKLAELSGQSVNTVNKLINELLEIEVDGQKLLRRELVGKGLRKKSMYSIYQGEITSTEAVEAVSTLIADEKDKAENYNLTTKDIAELFSKAYEETFGQGYVINYGKDLSLIKRKLVGIYDDATMTAVISYAVSRYKTEWANERYPLPTISMLCTWLANTAYGKWKQAEEKAEKAVERKQVAEDQDDSDKALELFNI